MIASLALAALVAAASDVPKPAAQRPICVDRSSPSVALDREVARAAMAAAGGSTAIYEYDGSTGVSEGFFRFLARAHCSLVMGYPIDSVNPDPPDGLALTSGYYATGYALASLGTPRRLHQLRPGTRVAVVSATAPDFYLVGAFGPTPKLVPDVFQTTDEALAALVARTDAVAMVWAPSAARYAESHPAARHIVLAALPIQHAGWKLGALYAPQAKAVAARFERGLATIKASGELARVESRSLNVPQ